MDKIRTVVVLAGGESVDAATRLPVADPDFVIAADSGLHHARALGLHVDLVVGDLDSVDAHELETAVAAGAAVERHPADKDATDLELALHAAIERGAERIAVAGVGGGRVDHFLANILVLASPAFARAHVEAVVGTARVVVIHDKAMLDAAPGDLVTLLPVGGPADGVRTTGLRFPLDGERLDAGTTRGVSNEVTADRATVTIDGGVLLVVQP
jgi:thiamine pyrophosphokinase